MPKVRRVVSAGLLAIALSAPAAAAHADPVPASRTLAAQADALRTKVADLQLQQSVATEAYVTAVAQSDQAISEEVRAQTALDAATGHSDSATGEATRRVRSLYMAGGVGPLATGLSRVLTTGDLDTLDEAARTAQIARSLLSDDATAVSDAAQAKAGAASAEQHLQQVRSVKIAAQAAAKAAADQVTAALAEQRKLLEDADAAVSLAVAQEEEQAQQAALAAAVQRASAAGVGDAVPGAAATGTAAAAVAAAWTRTGMAYVWGATGPTTFDCSGLTRWAYAQAGIAIPRTSRQQYAGLTKVPLDQLQPGDLVFYSYGDDPSTIHHVALYLGGGKVLHAPHTGDVVREASVAMPGLYGAVRPSA